jgi:hypothetical protein
MPDCPADRGQCRRRTAGTCSTLWGVARIGGGTAHVFYAPMIVDDRRLPAIRRQADVADALALVPCSRSSPAT